MDKINEFWKGFRKSDPGTAVNTETPYDVWSFGNTPKMADELGRLVVDGKKTATCSLLWDYEMGGESLPAKGERSIILDGEGKPLCIIETSEVEIKPYSEVDAAFAWEEGEGNRSLKYWREAHWRYFSRICPGLGRTASEDMPLVCERFRVVYHPGMDKDA